MIKHARLLNTLASARPEGLKALAKQLPPMRDTVKGIDSHLGEVLVAEAHIHALSGEEGYGMIIAQSVFQRRTVFSVPCDRSR